MRVSAATAARSGEAFSALVNAGALGRVGVLEMASGCDRVQRRRMAADSAGRVRVRRARSAQNQAHRRRSHRGSRSTAGW
jgi:hypothetical protein